MTPIHLIQVVLITKTNSGWIQSSLHVLNLVHNPITIDQVPSFTFHLDWAIVHAWESTLQWYVHSQLNNGMPVPVVSLSTQITVCYI